VQWISNLFLKLEIKKKESTSNVTRTGFMFKGFLLITEVLGILQYMFLIPIQLRRLNLLRFYVDLLLAIYPVYNLS
jgi:hypothetical protein